MLLSLIIPFTAVAQEAYAVYTNDGTLTFYYDNQRGSRTGTKYAMNTGHYNPGWIYDHRKDIKKAIFTPSFANARPISTFEWFHVDYSEESVLTEIIGLEYLDTSEVTDMYGMFWNSSNLTNLDLSHFNTSKVTNMDQMFAGCKSLTSIDVSHFKTNNVTTMWGMFDGCSGLTNLDVTKFVTGNVTDMNAMFRNCSNLTELDLSCFNTSLTTDMRFMFSGCNNLTTIYAGEGWNKEKVTKSTYMFSGCINLVGGAGTTYDVNHTDKEYARIDGSVSNPGYFTDKTAHAENEAYAVYTTDGTLTFYYDNQKSSRNGTKYTLNTGFNLPGWNTFQKEIKKAVFDSSFSGATPSSTFFWFTEASNLTEIEGMQYLNTANVTSMWRMFDGCSSLTSLDLSHFNTEKVTNMMQMFNNCSSLTNLDVSNFNTENVRNMGGMFSRCYSLASLDLSNFNTANVTSITSMFWGCTSLITIYADETKWSTAKITNDEDSQGMFFNCTSLVGGAGTKYDANHVNKDYAHIDGGPSNPGYLTSKNAAPVEICSEDYLQLRLMEIAAQKPAAPVELTICPDGLTLTKNIFVPKDCKAVITGGPITSAANNHHICCEGLFIVYGELGFKDISLNLKNDSKNDGCLGYFWLGDGKLLLGKGANVVTTNGTVVSGWGNLEVTDAVIQAGGEDMVIADAINAVITEYVFLVGQKTYCNGKLSVDKKTDANTGYINKPIFLLGQGQTHVSSSLDLWDPESALLNLYLHKDAVVNTYKDGIKRLSIAGEWEQMTLGRAFITSTSITQADYDRMNFCGVPTNRRTEFVANSHQVRLMSASQQNIQTLLAMLANSGAASSVTLNFSPEAVTVVNQSATVNHKNVTFSGMQSGSGSRGRLHFADGQTLSITPGSSLTLTDIDVTGEGSNNGFIVNGKIVIGKNVHVSDLPCLLHVGSSGSVMLSAQPVSVITMEFIGGIANGQTIVAGTDGYQLTVSDLEYIQVNGCELQLDEANNRIIAVNTTGIESIAADAEAKDGADGYYDLSGRRVATPRHGAYILRNGGKTGKIYIK